MGWMRPLIRGPRPRHAAPCCAGAQGRKGPERRPAPQHERDEPGQQRHGCHFLHAHGHGRARVAADSKVGRGLGGQGAGAAVGGGSRGRALLGPCHCAIRHLRRPLSGCDAACGQGGRATGAAALDCAPPERDPPGWVRAAGRRDWLGQARMCCAADLACCPGLWVSRGLAGPGSTPHGCGEAAAGHPRSQSSFCC
jgi:hypothetical protein